MGEIIQTSLFARSIFIKMFCIKEHTDVWNKILQTFEKNKMQCEYVIKQRAINQTEDNESVKMLSDIRERCV